MLLLLKGILNGEHVARIGSLLEGAPFVDGRLTAGQDAKPAKRNLQADAASEPARAAGDVVLAALGGDSRFVLAVRPDVVLPPLFGRYEPGMAYGDHLDNPVMGLPAAAGGHVRTDVSVTAFLTDPDGYGGGELVIQSDYGQQAFKGAAGDVLVYPSTLVHRVQPVTRGVRLVAVTWVQSLVRDPARRKILFDLAVVASQLNDALPGRPEVGVIQECHHNLRRMWAKT